ncbi:hypothetical protein ACJJTC_007995 [Scirpophaga incertulas]
MRKIPGPDYLFLIGNALDILGTPVQVFSIMRKYCNRWDRIFRFWSMFIGAVNIYTPDDVETIISTTKFNEKSDVYSFLEPWLQDGLLVSKGTKWHERRKILTPAFHFNILQRFFIVIEENSRRMVDCLLKSTEIEIDIIPLISEFTLNSICETAMGTQLSNENASAGVKYKNAIYKLGRILSERTTQILMYSDFIFNLSSVGRKQKEHVITIRNFTKKVIDERKKYIEINGADAIETEDPNKGVRMNKKKRRTAMLDLLILAQKENLIDDVGIQEEVDTFMFEGHDTTAAGLTYCLMLLANHKDIQDKIFAELSEIFKDKDQPTTYEDLNKMKYLDCCIKESLRLYPPVPFISRNIKEPTKLGEYEVPANIFCHIHIYDLHRRGDLFPNPLKFDPDRFLPENSVGRHPFAYIPFSAGPRNCIGQRFAIMEMKTALSAILRRFELLPVTRPMDLHTATELVLRNNGPIYITFRERL